MVVAAFAALLLAADGGSKLPLKPGYAEARSFPARHATQAAAAGGKVVYAVSNGTVAVHDRETGKSVRESEGPAEHLNSAFVWGGKVYCAHSNYPKKPDTSDIRVYDPATNTLTVFHDFKDPPGSLVWNVHDGKNWWCCFAHYGEDNPKTVLIRYADGFKEEKRWTFPKAVVADWDGMSASGGVWDGDTLLVSHHHWKVLYRLRVPKGGAELELVEALACPFPGQGIAADPATGGLVGIDRTRRAVVFADKPKPKAAPPAPDPEELVRRLGAPAFADREAAGRRLLVLGPAAEPALRAAARSADPEVARRAAVLLRQLAADAAWRAVAGTDDRPTPAWEAFRGIAGDTEPSRLLYRRLTAGGRYARLAEAAGNPDAAAIGYAAELARVRAAYEKEFPPGACGWGFGRNRRAASLAAAPPEDVALVLFLGALARTDAATDPAAVGSIQYEGFTDLAGGAEGPAARALFAAWLDRRRNPEARADGLYLALHTAIREALPVARRVLADPKAEARPTGYALLVLGNHGEADDLPRLAAFRNDTRVHYYWSGGGQKWTIQLRDVAAGQLLLAAGEDPKPFGFDWVRRGPADPADGPSYREAGWFYDPVAREAAHAKAWAWLDERAKVKAGKN